MGCIVRANGNSHRTYVDPYGNGVASATGVTGDHVRRHHDLIVSDLVSLLNDAGVRTKGGHTGSCKGTFNKCIDTRLLDEDGERKVQGIIPDMIIDARGSGGGPFIGMCNRLVGRQTLGEHKTLASTSISVQARVERVRQQYLQHARELDRRYPGSTFEQELRTYGLDGALCVLVSGPFANLSEDFKLLVDLIAREKATAWIEKRNVTPKAALALFKLGVVRHLGLFVTRGWSQLIIDRWRDAVTGRPHLSAAASAAGLNADADFSSSNPRHSGYCGMHVPGA